MKFESVPAAFLHLNEKEAAAVVEKKVMIVVML